MTWYEWAGLLMTIVFVAWMVVVVVESTRGALRDRAHRRALQERRWRELADTTGEESEPS